MKILLKILTEAWGIAAVMAPYLLFGFLAAGILGVFVPARFIERHLGRRGLRQIIKASLLGVPVPLCSCSVIPVTASLRRHGATPGAAISFLTSTPQTGVDSIAATWGLLGPLFTAFRVATAFLTGVICGTAVEALTPPEPAHNGCLDNQCPACNPRPGRRRLAEIFRYGFVVLPRDIGRSLLAGLLIAGVLGALIPADFFTRHLSSEWLSMAAVMALGIPLYVCSTGSIPIALGMIAAGLSPGAALAFLITGPATNAATLATVLQSMGRRTVLIYLATLCGCALTAGWLLNRILPAQAVTGHIHHHTASAGVAGHLSALLLAGILIGATLPRRKKKCCSDHAGKGCRNTP